MARTRMFSTIVSVSIYLILLIPKAKADSCAKAKIVSGDQCEDLEVQISLSSCNDTGEKTVIQCHKNGTAAATLRGKNAIYSVKLKESPNAEPKSWYIIGETEITPIKHEMETPASSALDSTHHHNSAPAPEENHLSPPTGGLTINGILDAYYGMNFNQTPSINTVQSPAMGSVGAVTLPAIQNSYRTNDLYSNSFAVNLAEVSISRKGKETNFKIDLDFGTQADWFASLAPRASTDEVTKHIGQAYVTWTPHAKLTVNFGKMYSFLGYETSKAKDNWNYSRALLFQLGTPIWHTGANATYSLIPGKVSIGAHIYNGLNDIFSQNAGKTLGLQLALIPSESITLNINGITGPENPDDTVNKFYLVEVNMQWIISHSWSVAFDVAYSKWNKFYITGLDSNWTALEMLAKWHIVPTFYLSARTEIFADPQGAASGLPDGQLLTEATLTAGLGLGDGLETRLEGRADNSNKAPFISAGVPVKTQATASISFLYSF